MAAAPENALRRGLLFAVLIAAAAALYLAGLGRLPLLGRDEALYAEAAREMLARGDWVTPRVNGGPFFEKPPLYYWLAALSYRAFGVSPFAARLPAALAAIFCVALIARIGARAWGARAGLLAGLTLATSLQMAVVGRMGIMDAPLTCLTVLALLSYERWRGGARATGAAAFGCCLALALLLKGAAGLIPAAVAALDALRGWGIRPGGSRSGDRVPAPGRRQAPALPVILSVLLAAVVLIAVASPWFILMSQRHGPGFQQTFLGHEHVRRILQPMQGHGGPFWVYLPLILIGFFPWSVFLPHALARRPEGSEQARFWRRLCLVWITFVLIGFSAIRTKLPGYITPLFPPLALLVGAELSRRPGRAPAGRWAAVLAGAILLAGLVALLPGVAARLAEKVGTQEEARLLVAPAVTWAVGYLIIASGAGLALSAAGGASTSLSFAPHAAAEASPRAQSRGGGSANESRSGLGVLTLGQLLVVAAALLGVLPVLSPYLGGGSARLAQLARQQLPGHRLLLYETRPEAVAFVLQQVVPTFDRKQQRELEQKLRDGPIALIAPLREQGFWQTLPATRGWRLGDCVLLEIRADEGRRDQPAPRSEGG